VNYPAVEDIDRIAHVADPAVRNLQITQSYYEITRAVRRLTGASATRRRPLPSSTK
jgi:hypothetical protein